MSTLTYRLMQTGIDVVTVVVAVVVGVVLDNWGIIISQIGDALPGNEAVVPVLAGAVFVVLTNLRRELQRRIKPPPAPVV